MTKTVMILSHPTFEQSLANKTIVDTVRAKAENLEIRHLDDLYPDFKIDVDAEQKALLEADTIVLQFPFYWYSVPPRMKQWFDSVLSFNFAYGPEGDKLKGKKWQLSFTTGGPKEAYSKEGYNNYSVEELLPPLEQTANLCQVDFQPPIYSNGMMFIPGMAGDKEDVLKRAKEHGERLLATLA